MLIAENATKGPKVYQRWTWLHCKDMNNNIICCTSLTDRRTAFQGQIGSGQVPHGTSVWPYEWNRDLVTIWAVVSQTNLPQGMLYHTNKY